MTYKQSVKAAAVALTTGEDANWQLAKLTYQNTKGANGKGQPGQVTMAEWCADVVATSKRQFSTRTGSRYRKVWVDFGSPAAAVQGSWDEAYATVMTSGTTRTEEVRSQRSITKASPEVKRETFRQLAADKDVAPHKDTAKVVGKMLADNPTTTKALMDERTTQSAMLKASFERDRERREQFKKNLADKGFSDFTEVQQQAAEAAEFVNVLNLLGLARHKIAEAVQTCVRLDLTKGQRSQVERQRDGIALAMEYLDSYLSGSKASLEDELAKMLEDNA